MLGSPDELLVLGCPLELEGCWPLELDVDVDMEPELELLEGLPPLELLEDVDADGAELLEEDTSPELLELDDPDGLLELVLELDDDTGRLELDDELLDEEENGLLDEELLELGIVAPFEIEFPTAAPAGCRQRLMVFCIHCVARCWLW